MLIIDRIEEGIAVCEASNGDMINIPLDLIKCDTKIKEGDCIFETETGYIIDKDLTAQKRKKIDEILENLWDE